MPLQSKFAAIEGHQVHYWEGGQGFPLLMVHGVGPGTSIVGNFAPVLEPLCANFHVFAVDLIGFGESSRKKEGPYFDAELWLRQISAMLDLIGEEKIGIAGHSFGGALALKTASRSGRIARVLTSSTIGAPYRLTNALDTFWSLPADRQALQGTMRLMVHDATSLTDAMIDDRWKLMSVPGYSEYFSSMFAPPRQRFIDAAVLTDHEAKSLNVPLMMLHGQNDQPCPAEVTTLALARMLPQTDVRLFGQCGHNLPRERTGDYLNAVREFFGSGRATANAV